MGRIGQAAKSYLDTSRASAVMVCVQASLDDRPEEIGASRGHREPLTD